MKLPQHPRHDYLKHFAKDDAATRIKALALVMAPAIIAAISVLLIAVLAAAARWIF